LFGQVLEQETGIIERDSGEETQWKRHSGTGKGEETEGKRQERRERRPMNGRVRDIGRVSEREN
jgi:hypothetical protein